MNQFKDLGIQEPKTGLIGDKIKVERLLDKEIEVERYQIEPSKHFKGDCLHMQIKKGEDRFVAFTSGTILINMIKQIPLDKFPFKTVIRKENDRYKFS